MVTLLHSPFYPKYKLTCYLFLVTTFEPDLLGTKLMLILKVSLSIITAMTFAFFAFIPLKVIITHCI